MAPELLVALALLAAFNAYALHRFLKRRAAYKEAVERDARATRALAAIAQGGQAPAAASVPLALKEDLRAIEDELLSIRARLNNHEVAHMEMPEYESASAELAQVSAMLQAAKSENFSQLTQVAVEISAISSRLHSLESRLGMPQGAEHSAKPELAPAKSPQ
ncbi:MAG: hypothetical protein WC792_00055 [Candidatus Micrarchaeia archaeon]|jgi:hypothetical protein